jgi:hypothetical protein
MKQEGYLIITDISGYTSFLTKSELEHAHDILDSLFKDAAGQHQAAAGGGEAGRGCDLCVLAERQLYSGANAAGID